MTRKRGLRTTVRSPNRLGEKYFWAREAPLLLPCAVLALAVYGEWLIYLRFGWCQLDIPLQNTPRFRYKVRVGISTSHFGLTVPGITVLNDDFRLNFECHEYGAKKRQIKY